MKDAILFDLALAVIAFVFIFLLGTCDAQAQDVPLFSDDELHVLARTLVAEADWDSGDYAPISYVLLKRWRQYSETVGEHRPLTFIQFMGRYSAVWHKPVTPRKTRIRALPFKPVDGFWWSNRWTNTIMWVRAWSRNVYRDPCPRALHWGSKEDWAPRDHQMRGWKITDCGRTRNIFYAPYRRRNTL